MKTKKYDVYDYYDPHEYEMQLAEMWEEYWSTILVGINKGDI